MKKTFNHKLILDTLVSLLIMSFVYISSAVAEDFGPFTTVLTNAKIRPPERWNSNFPLSDQSNKSHWTLNPAFSDEFNQTTLDANKWYPKMPYANQGADPTLLVPTKRGLEFHMRKGPQTGQYIYRGSYIASKSLLLYGYIEANIKMAANYANNNMFLYAKEPAEWTEIDVVEIYPLPRTAGVKAASNAHVWYSSLIDTHTEQQTRFTLNGGQTFADRYHVFGLAWTPTTLAWYIDGQLVREGVNSSWYQPLNLYLGVWDLHNWMSQMDPALIPIEAMKVKYVRVWTARN
jgi:beta-glucanase (GH16 family)